MSRRGPHEGSIFRRKDGRWCARIQLEDGRRKHFYGETRSEVKDRLTDALKARKDGLPLPSDLQTVRSFADTWIAIKQQSVREQTWRRYQRDLRLYVVPAIGSTRLTRLQPEHVLRVHERCRAKGLGGTSVRHVHRVVHNMLGEATRMGAIARNPATLVSAPRMTRHEMSVWSNRHARKFLECTADEPLHALYVLALTTGMRQGELMGLRWKDVDIPNRALSVTGSLQQFIGGRRQIVEPKTQKSRRRVALTQLALDALEQHRDAQQRTREHASNVWKDLGVVFAQVTGQYLSPKIVGDDFARLSRRARVPRIRFHDLRHTSATLALRQGAHPKVVSEMLGHSTVGITLDLYSHVSEPMQRDLAESFDRVLGRSAPTAVTVRTPR